MGADIRPVSETMQGEPAADLLVRTASLKGTVIEGSLIPALIDELPVLAVMAAAAEGETVIRDAAELKVKESDRIATVTEGLRAMGADITPTDDGMIIRGGRPLHGALIHTYGDHRLAMSFAVAGMIAEGETLLDNAECAAVSYPAFFTDLQRLQM
jgi:3-phosphoshikimate 1-carboxyvinyltransferase